MGAWVGNRAIVLGGGMAGLLATRVLSETYAEVLVIDRDQLLGVTDPRRSTPQAWHAHALLARGQQVLAELFPGLTGELEAAGMPMTDMGMLHWYLDGERLASARTGLVVVNTTRPALEFHVRRRVAALANVRFVTGCDILGPVASADRSQIIGVRVHHSDEAAERIYDADLVVDATGRGSRMPVWLGELGYQRPAEDRVKIDLSYSTCIFRLPVSPLEDSLSIIPLGTPNFPTGAFFGRVGGNRHVLSLTRMLGAAPPADLATFREVARELCTPRIYEAIKDAEPEAPPVVIRFPASVRRRYERLPAFPARMIVIGDGLCSFNPIYGQGMTVSALEALALRDLLAEGRAPEPLRFLQAAATIIDTPWAIAAGGDLAWPGVQGERTPEVERANAYMGRLQSAARFDGRITAAFMRVAGLIEPPESLFAPEVATLVDTYVPAPAPAEQAH
ncbi:FAD-binding monooxygenase [Micromonospora sp. NPDC048999]|uniref:FAD-dependent oxidoreductase n=1 Tax=Micromonospora sp. NPDC048999 TaxID=3155391 RepID=UPI0033C8FD9A